MQKKYVKLVLLLFVCSQFFVLPQVNSAESGQSIIIEADGSITGTDKIERDGDCYYLTDDIDVSNFTLGFFAGITVQRDNIIIDGKGFSIQNNEVFMYGLDLSARSNVTLQNLKIIGFTIGIYMCDGTSDNIIIDNTIIGPSAQSYQIGIWVQDSSNDKLTNNTVKGYNEFGIYLYLTSSCYISGNVVTNNKIGVSVEYSEGNIFRDNQIYGNTENFLVAFKDFEHVVHDADDSNIVNGKPMYYWVNKHNMSVPSDAGFVALVNCSGISVQNLEISNNGVGILCYSTTGSVIENNTLELNGNTIEIRNSQNINVSDNFIIGSIHSGIRLAISDNIAIFQNILVNNAFGITLSGYNNQNSGYDGSTNVTILRNYFTGNSPAIDISRSNDNVISGNNFTDNDFAGIRLVNSKKNLVVNNTFTANDAPAVYLSGATNNIFYHNNFINNRPEELSISNPWFWGSGDSESNNWDNGYEGNYWSEYSIRYPNATALENSGIWDTSFVINEENIDRFPLTDPIEMELITISEFESWIILALIGTVTLLVTFYRKKLHKKIE